MGAHVHKTTYGPLVDTALYLLLLMRANLLQGQGGGGWSLEILTFLGPKWQSPNGSMSFHRAQKVSISRAQSPPTCPRNGFAHIKSITYRAVSIICPKIASNTCLNLHLDQNLG